MDELTVLLTSVTDFTSAHAMTVVPAIPENSLGPQVRLDDDRLDLRGFLELAQHLGARAVYLQAEEFLPEPGTVPDPPLDRLGELYHLELAFVGDGVLHHWEHTAAWFTAWREQADNGQPEIKAVIDSLLGMSEFRAAAVRARRRIAELHVPDNVDHLVRWAIVSRACERAEELTQHWYAHIEEQYDELAAQLLDDPEYRSAGSAAGRKTATVGFLTRWAEGWCPLPAIRDELYARTRDLAKTIAKPSDQP
ncbi:hypothetical protein [Krasilnikovia sp. MM14-A1259]|uniref:hypothetical protein n=1 Tax=Krasilnikovia sp. MM14-A1259 TaxID=3373539 RepID=UPI003812ADD3